MRSGASLKALREAANVRAADLARALGLTRSAITHLEARDTVQPVTAGRYIEAVAVIATKRQAAVDGAIDGASTQRLIGAALMSMGADLLEKVGA